MTTFALPLHAASIRSNCQKALAAAATFAILALGVTLCIVFPFACVRLRRRIEA